MEYSFRETKRESRRFRLEDEALVYTSSKKGVERIPYEDIGQVQLFSPREGVFVCRIKTKSAGHLALANRSFVKLGTFENHNAEYRDFVAALHAKTAQIHSIRYVSGLRWFYYFSVVSLILVLGGGMVALGLILWAWSQGKLRRARPWTIITPLVIFFAVGLPALRYAVKQGKGGEYRPDDLPAKALPPAD